MIFGRGAKTGASSRDNTKRASSRGEKPTPSQLRGPLCCFVFIVLQDSGAYRKEWSVKREKGGEEGK